MKAELIYVTDVYCLWCFGFSVIVDRIATEYADRIELKLVNGGMIQQDMPLRTFFGRFPDPIGLHQRVTDTSGQEFGASYLDQIRHLATSNRVLNSLHPARAITALEKLGAADRLKVASEIQRAHYMTGRDLSDPYSYQDLDCMQSVDFDRFKVLFADDASLAAVIDDFQWVNAAGIQGFPALILKQSQTQYMLIARGFMPYEAVKTGLDAAFASMSGAEEGAGTTCRLDGTGC